MPDNDQRRRELCRIEVREYLANRPRLAFDAVSIRRSLFYMAGADWTDEEIEAACDFLLELAKPQVTVTPEELGATKRYKITSEGIVAHERRP